MYKASWIAQATENNQLTDWAFSLKPMPPWACDSAKVRERIFDVRSRAAQELMDIVQDHLTETSASLKEDSDKAMKGLEAAFNKDQKLSSKKSVEEHTDKHLQVLTETLSRRRELLILNQPTLNEAVTMKAERRAYPSRKDDDPKISPLITDADLTDLSDEDQEERFEKRKLSARKKVNAPKPRRGNANNQRANPRAPRRGQPPARGQPRPEYEQPRQGPPKRPRQSYDPRPSTSGQTNEGYGNQNQNWSNNRPSHRWTPTTHEPSYNSYTPAPPTPAPRPAQQFYRENPAGESYVVDYSDDYNVGSEDATPPRRKHTTAILMLDALFAP